MKKKLFLVFSLLLCIFLVSCRTTTPMTGLSEKPTAEAQEQLNLSVLNDAASINKDLDRTQKNYVDVKLPADLANSLVVRHVNVYEAINENRVKGFNVKALTFFSPSLISAEYKQAIMSELYNAEYGINKDKLGLSVDILTSVDFSYKLSNSNLEYYEQNKENTNITVSVIYLPAKVAIKSNKVLLGEITVLVPVYAEFNLGDASELFDKYNEVTLELVEDQYGDLVLPNVVTE